MYSKCVIAFAFLALAQVSAYKQANIYDQPSPNKSGWSSNGWGQGGWTTWQQDMATSERYRVMASRVPGRNCGLGRIYTQTAMANMDMALEKQKIEHQNNVMKVQQECNAAKQAEAEVMKKVGYLNEQKAKAQTEEDKNRFEKEIEKLHPDVKGSFMRRVQCQQKLTQLHAEQMEFQGSMIPKVQSGEQANQLSDQFVNSCDQANQGFDEMHEMVKGKLKQICSFMNIWQKEMAQDPSKWEGHTGLIKANTNDMRQAWGAQKVMIQQQDAMLKDKNNKMRELMPKVSQAERERLQLAIQKNNEIMAQRQTELMGILANEAAVMHAEQNNLPVCDGLQ